jgi:hypothetical protein
LDSEGCDLPDLSAVRHAAIATTTEVLGGIKAGPTFWSGEPWKLWVTDEPNGADLADAATPQSNLMYSPAKRKLNSY